MPWSIRGIRRYHVGSLVNIIPEDALMVQSMIRYHFGSQVNIIPADALVAQVNIIPAESEHTQLS